MGGGGGYSCKWNVWLVVYARRNFHQWSSVLECVEGKVTKFHGNISLRNHFQHDGALCHRTKTVGKWLADNRIQILGSWPGNSPDLNPIENSWVILKQKVATHNPSSLTFLKQVIKEIWVKKITPEYYEKLCLSMPKRIQAC